MQTEYEKKQAALKQKLAKQQLQDQINQLETKLSQIIQIQKDIEESDFQYQSKQETLKKKKRNQMKDILKLKESQKQDLNMTKNVFSQLYEEAVQFQNKQQEFIIQQKLDKDQLKSFQVTQQAKKSVYEVNKEVVVSQNPFVLLSQAQGFLDSQYDSFYQQKIIMMKEILQLEQQYSKSLILLTFVSFKPDIPTLEQFQQRKYEGTINQIPLSLELLIDFYDFPTYKSNVLIYEDCPTIDDIRKLIGQNQELKLAYQDYYTNKQFAKKPCFSFEVENDYKLIYYLMFKNVFIRVLDSITGENYGYCQIPLNQIVRLGKKEVYNIVEAQILSYDWTITHGVFTITIQNIGLNEITNQSNTKNNFGQTVLSQEFNSSKFQQSQLIQFNQTMDNKSTIQETFKNISNIQNISNISDDNRIKLRISQHKPQSQISQARKKRISKTPKDLTSYQKQPIINEILDNVEDKLRLHERIKSKKSNVIGFLSQQDNFSKLKAVQLTRNFERQEFLSKVLPSHMNPIEIQLPVGEKCIQILQYHNQTEQDIIIQIEIDHPIAYLAEDEELEQIYESQEISFDNRVEVNQYQFKSHALSTSFLAIVFYSTIEINIEFNVAVYFKTSSIASYGQLYKVLPKSQIIDMQFDFVRQANQQITLYLPTIFCFCEIEFRQNPIIRCNKQEVTFGLHKDDKRIKLELKTADVCKQIYLLLFLYRDKFCHQLLLTVSVKITSLQLIKFSTIMGQPTICQIELQSDKDRQIYIHSLNQDKLWFETPFDKPLQFQQNIIVNIPVYIYQMTTNSHIVKVNAMDQLTNELVYSWLIQISADMPIIQNVFTYNCYFRNSHPFKLIYKNQTKKQLNLNIVTSSFLLKPLISQIKINPEQKENIEMILMKAEEYPKQDIEVIDRQREIQLFIYDIKNKIFECFLFQINLYDIEQEWFTKSSNLIINKSNQLKLQ